MYLFFFFTKTLHSRKCEHFISWFSLEINTVLKRTVLILNTIIKNLPFLKIFLVLLIIHLNDGNMMLDLYY